MNFLSIGFRLIVVVFVLTTFNSAVFAQTANVITVAKMLLDSSIVKNQYTLQKIAFHKDAYEKITLDNAISYKNKTTGEIISEADYLEFTGQKAKDSNHPKNALSQNISNEFWSQTRVNPYRDKITLPSYFPLYFDQMTFTPPIDGKMVITSRYGRRRRGPHKGIDIDLVTGDFVRSVLPGKVRLVGYSSGHGKTVVVRHAHDVETVYAHLSGYAVRVNDVVKEGQIIGFGGNTGRSRGSHLHLEVRYKGVCIHPEYVFNFDGTNTINGQELWVSSNWRNPRNHSSYHKSKITPLTNEEQAIAFEANQPKYYRIRKGDTLSKIARKNNLYLKEICRMNGLSTSSVLRIGKMLRIR